VRAVRQDKEDWMAEDDAGHSKVVRSRPVSHCTCTTVHTNDRACPALTSALCTLHVTSTP
jgi:hypothetical protein